MGARFRSLGTATLLAAGALTVAGAQASPPDTIPAAQSGPTDPAGAPVYATGKPLQMQSHEGFWGHVNPFARKKWVHRQIDPMKDQLNELDELQARNSHDIRDVDTRATAGIAGANSAAAAADARARAAGDQAGSANSLAVSADARTSSLHGTVSTLDQYQPVTSTAVSFTPGHAVLGPRGKATLDAMAARLGTEKGYIVEVQGYSRAGVPQSTAMADAVVRYLVEAHQVPLYRIYRTGLGRQTGVADGEAVLSNGVRVTLLHNSLATMGAASSAAPPVAP